MKHCYSCKRNCSLLVLFKVPLVPLSFDSWVSHGHRYLINDVINRCLCQLQKDPSSGEVKNWLWFSKRQKEKMDVFNNKFFVQGEMDVGISVDFCSNVFLKERSKWWLNLSRNVFKALYFFVAVFSKKNKKSFKWKWVSERKNTKKNNNIYGGNIDNQNIMDSSFVNTHKHYIFCRLQVLVEGCNFCWTVKDNI